MNIVIEGPDGAGKSTLADELVSRLPGYQKYHSPGPAATHEELNERVIGQLQLKCHIFDRHTCVSEYIYGAVRGYQMTDDELTKTFYRSRPLFVYCAGARLENHKVRPGEDADHIAMVEHNFQQIKALYDVWAYRHAHIYYRIGDDVDLVQSLIEGAIQAYG